MAEQRQGKAPPRGWGDDKLSGHMQDAFESRWATFANKRDTFAKLVAVDHLFLRASSKWTNPKAPMSALLLIRAHSAFRAACENAAAGQCAEAFIQIRACLEAAGYALHIAKNPGMDEVWLRRHDSEADAKSCKQAFTVANVKTTVKASNLAAATLFDDLYGRSIDFGGHPNERSITANLRLTKEGSDTRFDLHMLIGDGVLLNATISATFETGACALYVLREAFPERFQLLGVEDELLRLHRL